MSSRGMGQSVTLYALGSTILIGLAAAVFVAMNSGAAERQAVLVSAVVALVVQVVAFSIARIFSAKGNGIAGWGLGAIICFATLVIYGFLCRALGLPSNVALLSLATFFFLTELIEPPLLNP